MNGFLRHPDSLEDIHGTLQHTIDKTRVVEGRHDPHRHGAGFQDLSFDFLKHSNEED